MAYIGKSPTGTGVRSRYYYTQGSAGGTSVSGNDDSGKSLNFTDGEYVDVYLNGVLLVSGTDYNTSTANTVAGLAAMAASDVVEVVVYDIFTVADSVSKATGGTFGGNVGVSGTVSLSGNVPIYQNKKTIDTNYTITDGFNAMSAGPITISSGVTVTVGSGETWTVV